VTTHQTVTSAPTATTYQFESGWDAGVIWASGGRHSLAVMNNPNNVAGATNFIFTGASGKYRELKSLDGNCLDLDGPIKGVYYVWEDTCAGRASELWWLTSPHSNGVYEIINDYGTNVLKHNACMWNQDQGSVNGIIYKPIILRKCVAPALPAGSYLG